MAFWSPVRQGSSSVVGQVCAPTTTHPSPPVLLVHFSYMSDVFSPLIQLVLVFCLPTCLTVRLPCCRVLTRQAKSVVAQGARALSKVFEGMYNKINPSGERRASFCVKRRTSRESSRFSTLVSPSPLPAPSTPSFRLLRSWYKSCNTWCPDVRALSLVVVPRLRPSARRTIASLR